MPNTALHTRPPRPARQQGKTPNPVAQGTHIPLQAQHVEGVCALEQKIKGPVPRVLGLPSMRVREPCMMPRVRRVVVLPSPRRLRLVAVGRLGMDVLRLVLLQRYGVVAIN
jgi:hypothetical protein